MILLKKQNTLVDIIPDNVRPPPPLSPLLPFLPPLLPPPPLAFLSSMERDSVQMIKLLPPSGSTPGWINYNVETSLGIMGEKMRPPPSLETPLTSQCYEI